MILRRLPVSRQISRFRRDERGVTLVELLVSLVVLGIILAGLASTVLASLRAAVNSEHEARATAFASQAVEELQAVDWDSAALYEDEIAGADALWQARVGTGGVYEDEELVETPGPGGFGREAQVPVPTSTSVQGNVTYRVDRYVFWVDRSGDGIRETKRFVAEVTWDSRGRERSLSLASERVPTEGEATSTVTGTRVLEFWVSPNPVPLDADNLNDSNIRYVVSLNRNVTQGQLAFFEVDAAGDPFLVDLPMDEVPTAQAPGEPGWYRWELIVNEGDFEFREGTTQVRFRAFDPDLNEVEAFRAISYTGGTGGEDPLPSPPPLQSGGGFPNLPGTDPDDDNDDDNGSTEPPDDLEIDSISADDPLCVRNNDWRIADPPYVVTTETRGLDEFGTVSITYQYVSNKSGQNATYQVVTDNMSFVSGDEDGATWAHEIPTSRLFKPGDLVFFNVTASPQGDSASVTDDVSVTVSSGGGC